MHQFPVVLHDLEFPHLTPKFILIILVSTFLSLLSHTPLPAPKNPQIKHQTNPSPGIGPKKAYGKWKLINQYFSLLSSEFSRLRTSRLRADQITDLQVNSAWLCFVTFISFLVLDIKWFGPDTGVNIKRVGFLYVGNMRNSIVTPKSHEVVNKLDLWSLPVIRKTTLCLGETLAVQIVSEEMHVIIYRVCGVCV